jgi:hypothetical protein
MQRKTAKEQCERLRKLQPGPLRRQCLRFITDHADAIAQARPDLPPSLNDRAADVWEPLLALADLAGGDWPQLARQAAVSLTSIASENNPIGSLLLDIFITFTESKSERLFSRTLVTELNRFAARPWMEMCKGKEITELWLAQQLRPYGIRPRTLWIGEAAAKGYVQAEFMDIFRRYITKSDLDAVRMEPKPRAKPAHSEKPTP